MAHAMERREKTPDTSGPHNHGQEVDEQNEQRHDHQQRPLERLQFCIGRQAQIEREQHACEPREDKTPHEENDQPDDEPELDALLDLRSLEGDESHGASQAQPEDQRNKESALTVSSLTGKPVTQRQLVRDRRVQWCRTKWCGRWSQQRRLRPPQSTSQ